jgi:hypothetical protein
MFPPNVIALISAYSKPCTNPNWRSRQWISIEEIYKELYNNSSKNVYNKMLLNIHNGYHWATINANYECYGLKHTSIKYDIPIHLLHIIVNVIYNY